MVELFVSASVLVATVSSVTVGGVSVCVFDDRNKHVLGYLIAMEDWALKINHLFVL